MNKEKQIDYLKGIISFVDEIGALLIKKEFIKCSFTLGAFAGKLICDLEKIEEENEI